MISLNNILFKPLLILIHKDFHEIVRSMSLVDKFIFLIVHLVDKFVTWHRLPVFLGLIYLGLRRRLHQNYNLFTVGNKPTKDRFNDPTHFPGHNDEIGSFFGRNIIPIDQSHKLTRPDPMLVATKLLARRDLIDTGKQFNMIAASWIQFMIHDWIDHIENTNQQVELRAPEEVANQCPLKSFKFFESKEVQITNDGHNRIKSGYLNRRTPWWDGSAIYGNDEESVQKVRTYKDGKLKISEDGLLLVNPNGVVLSAMFVTHGLVSQLCKASLLRNTMQYATPKEYPQLEDEEVYSHARLVTSAVIAKIHTIDWTIELLKTNTLLAAMRVNWYGLLGKSFKDRFGHLGLGLLSGIVGSKKPNDHGVPYSLTEEFVSVYRMHSLLPDKLLIRNIDVPPWPNKLPLLHAEMNMEELTGQQGTENMSKIGLTRLMVSMGHQACGALELWNYPMWLRSLVSQNVDGTDRPDPVDLPALEIYRDRERSVARYNDFRRALLLIPISKWQDLTDDEEAIETMRNVYGDDVENLDIMVGLMAEKKINGFAISETAFVIFLLMATRRLEADKYFTSHFNEEAYTKKGLEWVNITESLKDVLDRHYPEMSHKWINSDSAFSVWDAPPQPPNPVPLYLRLPN
ncbi:hypothetical protein CASFOL_026470 [Castilleja foliolosa]|uniref:Uncharacterized protein n=1 Tax=Castilleja foliolosa TaxID=1961234 RepID=A0ABD3CH60_9LAMI